MSQKANISKCLLAHSKEVIIINTIRPTASFGANRFVDLWCDSFNLPGHLRAPKLLGIYLQLVVLAANVVPVHVCSSAG